MARWVKDLGISLQGLELLLWCRLDPWPKNFHMWPKPTHIKTNKQTKTLKKKKVHLHSYLALSGWDVGDARVGMSSMGPELDHGCSQSSTGFREPRSQVKSGLVRVAT